MNDPSPDATDLPARAAYQAACDAKGIKPNWGNTGFQSKVEYWRSIAAAALNPVEPAAIQKTKKMVKQPTPLTLDLRSEEHTSELQSLMRISYDDFCLTKT